MDDVLARYKAMVAELRAQPKIRILADQILPPDEGAIERVEQVLGHELDPAISAFYRQCGGLQLRWVHVDNPSFNEERDQFVPEVLDWLYELEDYHVTDGSIMLVDVEDAFLRSWEGFIHFSGQREREEEFAGRTFKDFDLHVHPFDIFNKYNDMAFFLGTGTPSPPVIMGDDHMACYTDSYVTDFGSYLEFLLYSRGLIAARRAFYSRYRGDREPPKVTPASFFAGLPPIDLGRYDKELAGEGETGFTLPFYKAFWP
jgi:hypothetical protein